MKDEIGIGTRVQVTRKVEHEAHLMDVEVTARATVAGHVGEVVNLRRDGVPRLRYLVEASSGYGWFEADEIERLEAPGEATMLRAAVEAATGTSGTAAELVIALGAKARAWESGAGELRAEQEARRAADALLEASRAGEEAARMTLSRVGAAFDALVARMCGHLEDSDDWSAVNGRIKDVRRALGNVEPLRTAHGPGDVRRLFEAVNAARLALVARDLAGETLTPAVRVDLAKLEAMVDGYFHPGHVAKMAAVPTPSEPAQPAKIAGPWAVDDDGNTVRPIVGQEPDFAGTMCAETGGRWGGEAFDGITMIGKFEGSRATVEGAIDATLRAAGWTLQDGPAEPEPVPGSRVAIERATGGKATADGPTGTILVTLPAGTSAARVEEVRAMLPDLVPVFICADVKVEGPTVEEVISDASKAAAPCPEARCEHSRDEHAGPTGEKGCTVAGCPCADPENPIDRTRARLHAGDTGNAVGDDRRPLPSFAALARAVEAQEARLVALEPCRGHDVERPHEWTEMDRGAPCRHCQARRP